VRDGGDQFESAWHTRRSQPLGVLLALVVEEVDRSDSDPGRGETIQIVTPASTERSSHRPGGRVVRCAVGDGRAAAKG
jgi:hypothetical protein